MKTLSRTWNSHEPRREYHVWRQIRFGYPVEWNVDKFCLLQVITEIHWLPRRRRSLKREGLRRRPAEVYSVDGP
jgi:hypothetical protein